MKSRLLIAASCIVTTFFILATTASARSEYAKEPKEPGAKKTRKTTRRPSSGEDAERSVHTRSDGYNLRTNLYDLINSRIINAELDVGLLQPWVTIGPTFGYRSLTLTESSKFTYLNIGARANYYLNKQRYSTGIVLSGAVGYSGVSSEFTSTSLVGFTPTTKKYTANAGQYFLKALGLYQFWLAEPGWENLNFNGGIGLVYMTDVTMTYKDETGATTSSSSLSGLSSVGGGISLQLEVGVGYRF